MERSLLLPLWLQRYLLLWVVLPAGYSTACAEQKENTTFTSAVSVSAERKSPCTSYAACFVGRLAAVCALIMPFSAFRELSTQRQRGGAECQGHGGSGNNPHTPTAAKPTRRLHAASSKGSSRQCSSSRGSASASYKAKASVGDESALRVHVQPTSSMHVAPPAPVRASEHGWLNLVLCPCSSSSSSRKATSPNNTITNNENRSPADNQPPKTPGGRANVMEGPATPSPAASTCRASSDSTTEHSSQAVCMAAVNAKLTTTHNSSSNSQPGYMRPTASSMARNNSISFSSMSPSTPASGHQGERGGSSSKTLKRRPQEPHSSSSTRSSPNSNSSSSGGSGGQKTSRTVPGPKAASDNSATEVQELRRQLQAAKAEAEQERSQHTATQHSLLQRVSELEAENGRLHQEQAAAQRSLYAVELELEYMQNQLQEAKASCARAKQAERATNEAECAAKAECEEWVLKYEHLNCQVYQFQIKAGFLSARDKWDTLFECECRRNGPGSARCVKCAEHEARVCELQELNDFDLWDSDDDDESDSDAPHYDINSSVRNSRQSTATAARSVPGLRLCDTVLQKQQMAQFEKEVVGPEGDDQELAAAIAAVLRRAGYTQVTVAGLNSGLNALQQAAERDDSFEAVHSAAQDLLLQHMQSAYVLSAAEAASASEQIADQLMQQPGVRAMLADKPFFVQTAVAIRAAGGPTMDPQNVQQLVAAVQAVVDGDSCFDTLWEALGDIASTVA